MVRAARIGLGITLAAVAAVAAEQPDGSGDRCEGPADCAWADPCEPDRCVAGDATKTCEGGAPASHGTCACIDRLGGRGGGGECTRRWDTPPAPTLSCDPKAAQPCGIDLSRGVCVAPDGNLANGRAVVEGPYCFCNKDSRCELRQIERIACKTDNDCWLTRTHGFIHPTHRPKKLRGKKLKPCRDAETTPACDAGFCTLRRWKC